jgi:hypothetical protein
VIIDFRTPVTYTSSDGHLGEKKMQSMIGTKADELALQLKFSGFTAMSPTFNNTTRTIAMDVKECFDGVWQCGVEVTREGYYVYRKLIQPLLDDNMMPDNDIVIDFVTPSMSSVIGYVSNLSKLQGLE